MPDLKSSKTPASVLMRATPNSDTTTMMAVTPRMPRGWCSTHSLMRRAASKRTPRACLSRVSRDGRGVRARSAGITNSVTMNMRITPTARLTPNSCTMRTLVKASVAKPVAVVKLVRNSAAPMRRKTEDSACFRGIPCPSSS